MSRHLTAVMAAMAVLWLIATIHHSLLAKTGLPQQPGTRARARRARVRRVPDPAGHLGTASGWGIGLEMICLQRAEVGDLAQLGQPFVGRAGGDPHADPGQGDAVPGGA